MLLFVLLGVLVNAAVRSTAFPAGPGRPGPGEIVFTAAHDTAAEPVARSEVCYLRLYASEDEMVLRYSNEVLTNDESDRDVYISDGYKKDADGRQFYYIEHCYRFDQSNVNTDQATSDSFFHSGPSSIAADHLDGGGEGKNLRPGQLGDSRLVFGTSGRSLFKRQNSTAQDDNSALDDLNRVSEAIGGSDNVLDLGSGNTDASLESPTGLSTGDDGRAEGTAPEGVFGQAGRPSSKPSPTSTGPRIVKLSTLDAQTAVVHSDSRQSPTAAFGADPFFTTPSVFVAATPSLGPAPGSLSLTSLVGTLGTGAPASLSRSPVGGYFSSTSRPATSSLFVAVAGAPSPTGSVTTIVH